MAMRFLKIVVCVDGLAVSQGAGAVVECIRTVESVFSTDDGMLYIFWVEGGMGKIGPSDVDQRSTLALATTALVAEKSVLVRYADGATCSDVFRAIEGFQLNR
jgi:hypothetical protein